MKNKERLKSRLRPGETCKLNAVWYPGLDQNRKRTLIEKLFWSLVNSNKPIQFPNFNKCAKEMQNVNNGGRWGKGTRGLCTSLQLSVNL